jgi:hypothetical protein
MKLTPRQYAVAFTAIMGEISGRAPDSAAMATFESMIAAAPKSGKKEMLSSIRRLVSEAQLMSLEQCARVDAVFAKEGMPTLDVLADFFDGVHEAIVPTILARGSILDDEEARVVERALGDMTSDLTHEQRINLGEMINKFEGR